MNDYLIPSGYSEVEYTEKHSKFIGRLWHVESEAEALSHLADIKEKYWDAKHNVYAYSIKNGGIMRYSDDGEPGGTAGMPALDVFRHEHISDFCCIITRYFGGILLGTGGLVRAYSTTAKMALEAAGISEMRTWNECSLQTEYQYFEKMRKEVENVGGIVEETEFLEKVKIRFLLPEGAKDIICDRISEISAGASKVEFIGVSVRPLKIK